MTSQKKKDQVQNLIKIFEENPNFVLAKFENPSHQSLESLRKDLKKGGSNFKIVKNTLLEKAIDRLALSNKLFKELREKFFPLREKTALLVFKNDWAPGLKTFYEFSRKEKSLDFKLALIDQHAYGAPEVLEIAKLPSRQQLLGKIVASFKSPLFNLNYALKFNSQKLVFILATKSKQSS